MRFAAELGVTGTDQLPRLRSMSADRLYQLARADRELGNHYPVVDGHVLPQSPLAAFAAGHQADVPLMIGSNGDEGSVIRPLMGPPMIDLRHCPINDDKMQPEMADAFGDDLPRLLELYPGLDRRDPKAENDFMGDHMFGARVYHYARHHQAAGHPTYLYFFTRTPKSPKQTAGAYHAAELPFVHGSNVPIFPMTAADKALSAEMIRYWTDFAANGDPNPTDGSGGATHPAFPRFDADDPRWMRFDHTIGVEPVSRLEQYEIFNANTDRLVSEMSAMTD
jgi:para-nitrobenzyl esterase